MLGGFDPRLQELFLRRRRGSALGWGLLVLLAVGTTAWLAYPPPKEDVVEVQLEPEIQDFAIEEEEPEPEPEPPPPPDTKVKVVKNPKPKAKPKPPKKKVTDAVDESATEKTVEVGEGSGSPGGMGTQPKDGPPKAVEPKPKPKPEAPAPKPKPKAKPKPKIDPTKPVDRPENATAPKPDPGNASPVYPKELRDKGITGKVVIKLHVHRDGTVRGAKILRKSNNATTAEDQERANKLFLSAVAKAVKSWKFTPAKLGGEPITVWHTVTIPFTLSAG
ncbi:MAG: energy transducer TonB [Myxococcales bacterium]|nr:energy transducer TonB [Myxococcales bacterium]MCB9716928.1 energy transducer TonB [Myxococcales bacterium]